MLTKEALDELEAKHKRVAHVVGTDNAWECVFRKCTRAEYKQFKAKGVDEEQRAGAMEWLAMATVVYPSREDFASLLEDYPAIPEAASKRISALAGFGVGDSVKV